MTKLAHKLLDDSTLTLADQRQVTVICSTDDPDRMGDVIVQSGIDLTAYRRNPVVLWGHSADVPIARATSIDVEGGKLKARVQFPAEGEDEDADWVYGKIKAGIVNATSVGFIPKEFRPIDPKQPWAGMKFLRSELLEFSFVSVPANAQCLIVGRSALLSAHAPLLPSVSRLLGRATKTEKSGRAISRANEVLLLEVIDHHASATKLIKDVLKGGTSEDDGDDDPLRDDKALHRTKSGRAISSANEVLLHEAIDHHISATKCVNDVLESNGTSEDDSDDDPLRDEKALLKIAARRREAGELAAKQRSICASISDAPAPTRAQRIAEAKNFRRIAMSGSE